VDLKSKIVIAGGTGFFGKSLINYFRSSKQIIVFTRGISREKNGVKYINWNAVSLGNWVDELNGVEALINLSGKSIDCRFTEENKKKLLNSRIRSTTILAEAILKVKNPPKVWINASAGAMYRVSNEPNTEQDLSENDGFLSEMAKAWEKAFYQSSLPNTRRVAIRISLILGKQGGVFPVLKGLTKFGMGGKVGSGEQKVSWIHIQDACRAVEYIIENKGINEAVNFSTNGIVTNKLLMQIFRKVLGVKIGLPAPSFLVKIGTFFLRKEPSLLLESVNFIPKKLLKSGFEFNYENLESAIEDLTND